MPATKATVRFTMAPTSAAVRANSSRSGLRTCGQGARLARGVEDGGEGGQRAGHRPRQGGGAPDPHPREAGRVGVLRHGPHGEAPIGGAHGHGQRDGDDGRHDQGQHLRRGEDHRPDGEGDVEGHRDGLVQVLGPDEGQRGEGQQHLAQPDGGHHDQHPGPVEQPAEHQLGERADRRPPAPMERTSENQYSKWKSAVQLDQEDGGDDPDLALGEVE